MGKFLTKKGDADFNEFGKGYRNSEINRFWMKKGETKKIIVLGDNQERYMEHPVKTGNTFHQFTCAGEECVICAKYGKAPMTRECYTIFEIIPGGYIDKKTGEKKWGVRKPLIIGNELFEQLDRRRKECGGSLAGYMLEITRENKEKSKNVGDEFKVVKKADLSVLDAKYKELYKFEEVVAPLPSAKIIAILKYAGEAGAIKTEKRGAQEASPFDDQSAPLPPVPQDMKDNQPPLEDIPF